MEKEINYDFVRINSDRINDLVRLAWIVWGKRAPSLKTFKEKFNTENFGAKYIGYIAYERTKYPSPDETRIPAAYYGIFPTIVSFGDKEILCAQSGDTMTHPSHRGRGLFTDLAKETYKTAYKEGIQFVFGFPSEASFPGFANKLKWTFPYKMNRFTRFVPTIPIGILSRNLGKVNVKFSRFVEKIANILFDSAFRFDNKTCKIGSYLNLNGVIRDSRTFKYKSENTLFVKYENIIILLKYDGDISIGEILGGPSYEQMKNIMRRISILAICTGTVRIKSYYSPNSHLNNLISSYGSVSSSLPFGYVKLKFDYDPSSMELTHFDYDTY